MKREPLADLIENLPELHNKYSTGNSLFDFYPGDYVRCAFKRGRKAFYKVYGINDDYIVVSQIGDTEEFELIKPKFLERIELNPEWIKVLYSNQ